MTDQKKERMKRWLPAGLWTGLIYATLAVVRPVCTFLKQFAGFSFAINTVLVLLAVLGVVIFIRKKYLRRPSSYLLLAAVLALYAREMAVLTIPEERLHLIEYGVLAFLVFRALVLDLSDRWAFPAAFLITFLIGWGDEGIQYLLPDRYYQFSDVVLNGFSAALGLAMVYVVRRDHAA